MIANVYEYTNPGLLLYLLFILLHLSYTDSDVFVIINLFTLISRTHSSVP
jgi:hypothetical protein